MKPLVSVIIPTYNRAKYIDRAINSVLRQTYDNIELIIVDDNGRKTVSRNEMEEKMKKYSNNPKIHYLKHDVNMNGATARNTGISFSKGVYIAFLDDDDFFVKDRIEILVNDLENNSEYDAVYSSCVFFENNIVKKINIARIFGNLQYEMLRQIPFFSTGSNLFFRASALKSINGFDVSFKRHQDIEVMVRFFEKYKILNEKKILVAKCEEDKANFPNIDNAIKYKLHFLNVFENTINIYDSNKQKNIYHDNFFNLLKNAIRCQNAEKITEIKNMISNRGIFLTKKDKVKILLEKISVTIPIDSLYRKIRKNKYDKNEINRLFQEKNNLEN